MNFHFLSIISICLRLNLLFCTSVVMAENLQVKIGVSAPLTGDLAEYGAAVRNGITLAVEEHAKDFAQIQFIFEDNQYEPAKALTAYRKLREIDKVDLIYSWGEPPFQVIAPLAEQELFPLIAMSLDPKPGIGKKYVIRSINHAEQYAEKLVSYARSQGWKKIAILKTEDPFLNSMIDGIKKYLRPDENLLVYATFTPDEYDFKTQIAKLKLENFDALGVYLFSGQVSAFYRQALAQKFIISTFGTDFFESEKEIKDSVGGMNGAVYPNLRVPDLFHQNYRDHFKNDSQIAYAYNAYEFAKLASIVFTNLKTALSGEEIVNLFMHPPLSAPFQVKESDQSGRYYEFPLVIKKIIKDKIVTR